MTRIGIFSCLVLALGLLSVGSGGCAGKTVKPKAAGPVQPGTPDQAPGRVFTAQVDEQNLMLADEPAAKKYLRQKLVALLAKQLAEFGFPLVEAGQLSAAGRLEDFRVSGRTEKVPESRQELKLWDVRGVLQVVLSDQDVDALGEKLATLPMNSIEEAEAVAGYVAGMRKLKPDPRKYEALRSQVGDQWAEALRPLLKMQQQVPASPQDKYLASLEEQAGRLARFREGYPLHQEYAVLVKLFSLAALKVLKAVEVRAGNHPALLKLLKRLDQIAGKRLPEVMPYLMRDLELAWRNRLEKLSKDQRPFPEVYKDFFLFMQMFPRSDFYPDLELMFLVSWCDYLAVRKVGTLDELSEYIKEVNLLRVRFPKAGSGEQAARVLGRRCMVLLSKAEIPDLATLDRVKEISSRCDPFIPAGTDTVAMRQHIDNRESRLKREKDDREEKRSLRGQEFFIEWDKALRKLPWGKARAKWTGTGEFHQRWAQGRDAGADCRCSLDPEEPCRLFEEDGQHGGFEVVARFHQDKLEGVDICQVFAGKTIPVIYNFYKRRYKKIHKNREAAVFLSTTAGSVAFGRGKQLRVELERFSDAITVRYRHAPLQAQRRKAEKLEREGELESRKASRQERIRRGWQPGDCVRWDCGTSRRSDCTYTGTVKVRKEKRYQVLVTESEHDPVKQGRYLWVEADTIYDCR